MQNRTIDNALLALRRQGGAQSKLAEVLLDMRGVEIPTRQQLAPMKRGQAAKFVLTRLQDGPKRCPEIADVLQKERPDLRRELVLQRCFTALCRLEKKGLVRRESRVWKLAP